MFHGVPHMSSIFWNVFSLPGETRMNRVLIGVGLLLLILVGLIPGIPAPSAAREDSLEKSVVIGEINVYIEMVRRLAYIAPDESLAQEALAYIENVTAMDLTMLSLDELRSVRDTLASYFEDLKETLPEDVLDQRDVEEAIVREVLGVLQVVAEKYNYTSIEELYSSIASDVEAGNLDSALAKLEDVARALNEISVSGISSDLVEAAIELVRELSTSGDGVDTLEMGMERISIAMDLLSEIRDYLSDEGADPAAILAVDLAISTLNGTLTILENVAQEIGNQTLPGVVENAVNNTLAEKILLEISEERMEIEKYNNISLQLEGEANAQNKTYLLQLIEEARRYLANASSDLDMAEVLALNGSLPEAMMYLESAKVKIDYAENILDDVADALDITPEEPTQPSDNQSVNIDWLVEEMNELRLEISEAMTRAEYLMGRAGETGGDSLIGLLNTSISILENASMTLDMAFSALDNGSLVEAYDLYLEAKRLYEYAEEQIDMAEDLMEDMYEDMAGEVFSEIADLREEILEKRYKAERMWERAVSSNNSEAAALLTNATDILSQALSILENASEAARTGNYTEALQLIGEARALYMEAEQMIEQAEMILGSGMDDDHDEEYDDGEDEWSDEDMGDAGDGMDDDQHGDDEGSGDDGMGGGRGGYMDDDHGEDDGEDDDDHNEWED